MGRILNTFIKRFGLLFISILAKYNDYMQISSLKSIILQNLTFIQFKKIIFRNYL